MTNECNVLPVSMPSGTIHGWTLLTVNPYGNNKIQQALFLFLVSNKPSVIFTSSCGWPVILTKDTACKGISK